MREACLYIMFMIGILILGSVSFGRADLDRGKIKKGINAFEKEQWDESLQHFQDALLDDPENAIGHYNVAQALYKKQKYQEALTSYEKALNTQDPDFREKIYYNIGNTHYQMNKYQEAIQNYIKALEIDPDDQDAKHNLELVRAKLKEMAQKQPMQNQQNQQQQQQGNQDQSDQDKNEQQQQKSEQGEQEQQETQTAQQAEPQPQDQEKQQQEMQQMAEQPRQKKELTKEEAERILQALRSDEKENQKLRQAQRPAGKVPVEKDW